MKLQATLIDLERRVGILSGWSTIPGTSITRCQADRSVLAREAPEIKVPEGKEAMFVWVLGLGPAHERKAFWYGETIISAVRKAQKEIAEAEAEIAREQAGAGQKMSKRPSRKTAARGLRA